MAIIITIEFLDCPIKGFCDFVLGFYFETFFYSSQLHLR